MSAEKDEILAREIVRRFKLSSDGSRLLSAITGEILEGTIHAGKGRKVKYRQHQVVIDGRACGLLEHRVIWFLLNGSFPPEGIDHRDRNGLNNRPDNLRLSNQRKNGRNRSLSSNNTSGVNGVTWNKQRRKWVALAHRRDGETRKNKYLGGFETLFDAAAARRSYELSENFSEGHGQFCSPTAVEE